MFCPRLDHFARLYTNGTVGRCGHMTRQRGFESIEDMDRSTWLSKIKKTMDDDRWPEECVRCQQSEEICGESVRTKSIDRHKLLLSIRDDYLIVGGVLDNICNSACQTCNDGLSTKIGSLNSKNYFKVNNSEIFKRLPLDRIVELDISGGEPTASKNYRQLLKELPPNVKIVRMNTNGSRMISEIEDVLKNNIMVIVTMSLDGIGSVHDYTRWPIKWEDYKKTVDAYQELQKKYKLLQLDMWTTVSCLNIKTLPDITNFAKNKKIPHNWALLEQPEVLHVRYENKFTRRAKHVLPKKVAVDRNNDKELDEFINKQDSLRKINVQDYFNFSLK